MVCVDEYDRIRVNCSIFDLYSFSEYIPLIEKSLLILRLEKEWTAYQRGQMSLMGKALEDSVRRNGATFNSVIQGKIVHLKKSYHRSFIMHPFYKVISNKLYMHM